jgi:hypothetical protein
VQFPKFAIEVFFLGNFANHLKKSEILQTSAFIQTLCFCIPLAFCSRLFYGKQQALFACYSQSGHKDCAKYVAEICQQLLQIKLRLQIRIRWNSAPESLQMHSSAVDVFLRQRFWRSTALYAAALIQAC